MGLTYYRDCVHFRGDIPCKPHKNEGVHCDDCPYYEPKDEIILIIKLGAIGDVIRTTTLLRKLRAEKPKAEIWWLTYTPDVISSSVDKVFTYNTEDVVILNSVKFSAIINLDKDLQACALTSQLKAVKKYGFTIEKGKPAAIDEKAEHKFLTGIYDDVNKSNTKSYPEEIFEICGYEYNGEEYILEYQDDTVWDIPNNGKRIIGLNTGCGERWTSRLWKNENWIELCKLISAGGMFPMLLGGKQEHDNNTYLADKTGTYYAGHFSLNKFISLMNQTDAVVSAVTMAMHLAIGLKKPLILMNNIFNPNEFELYGRGEIIMPVKECKCFFSPKCKNPDYFCLDSLSPETIYEAIIRHTK